jgi:hypothetical protein
MSAMQVPRFLQMLDASLQQYQSRFAPKPEQQPPPPPSAPGAG